MTAVGVILGAVGVFLIVSAVTGDNPKDTIANVITTGRR
jgi:hypothetical protein